MITLSLRCWLWARKRLVRPGPACVQPSWGAFVRADLPREVVGRALGGREPAKMLPRLSAGRRGTWRALAARQLACGSPWSGSRHRGASGVAGRRTVITYMIVKRRSRRIAGRGSFPVAAWIHTHVKNRKMKKRDDRARRTPRGDRRRVSANEPKLTSPESPVDYSPAEVP